MSWFWHWKQQGICLEPFAFVHDWKDVIHVRSLVLMFCISSTSGDGVRFFSGWNWYCVCVRAHTHAKQKKRDSSPDASTPGIYLWGSLVQSIAWAIHLFLAKWTSGVQFEMPTSLDGISKLRLGWGSAHPKWNERGEQRLLNCSADFGSNAVGGELRNSSHAGKAFKTRN